MNLKKNLVLFLLIMTCNSVMYAAAPRAKTWARDFSPALTKFIIDAADDKPVSKTAIKKMYDQLNERDRQQAIAEIEQSGYTPDQFGIKIISQTRIPNPNAPKQAVPQAAKKDEKAQNELVQRFGALRLAEPRVVFLERHTEGGACTYNMLSDAHTMYNKLAQSGDVAKADLTAQGCPVNWIRTAQKELGDIEALQPDTEQINRLIGLFRILPHKNYVFIENGNQTLENKQAGKELIETLDANNGAFNLPCLAPAINALKQQPNTTQIFFMNMGAHWFAIVAYKKNGNITYYVSDRDHKQMSNDNKAAIRLLAKLLE